MSVVPKAKYAFFHRVGRDAFVDWAFILLIAAIVAASLVCVGVFAYVNREERLAARAATLRPAAPLSLDEAALERLLHEFDFRSAERAAVLLRYSGPSDPSVR